MTKDDQTQNVKFSKCKAKNFRLPWFNKGNVQLVPVTCQQLHETHEKV